MKLITPQRIRWTAVLIWLPQKVIVPILIAALTLWGAAAEATLADMTYVSKTERHVIVEAGGAETYPNDKPNDIPDPDEPTTPGPWSELVKLGDHLPDDPQI